MLLFERSQLKHLESDGEGKFKFIDNGAVSDEERQQLIDLDAEYYDIYQYHIITNHEKLNQKG